MECFWNMQWPVSIFLSVSVIVFSCLIAFVLSLFYRWWIKRLEHDKEKMKRVEELEKQKLYNEKNQIQVYNKRIYELEKQLKSLTDEKLGKKSKDGLKQDMDRIAFIMYALANKKDSSLDMEKLCKEIDGFKRIYKDFEKYLNINQ